MRMPHHRVGLADDLSVGLSIGFAKVEKLDPCSGAPWEADAVVTTLRRKVAR